MRNFTLYGVLAHLFLALFVVAPASAAVNDATDLYGTYEFTATLEITDAGQQYKDLFSDKCEVKITSHSVYSFSISGIGGSKADIQGANFVNGNTINVMQPNGPNYYLWGAPVIFGGGNGESPYGGVEFKLQYLVDTETKNITMPDFTAITVDETWTNSTVLARFSNCKLTFKEAEVVEVADMSGEYKYSGTAGIAESPVPVDFKMTLTATDDTHKLYDAAFDFGEGYVPFTLSATFNGDEMVMSFKDVYLNEEKTLALASGYDPTSLEGSLRFKKLTDTSLRLEVYLTISKFDAETKAWAMEQYTYYGVAAQPTADADNFAGTYHVKAGELLPMFETEDPYAVEYPAEFDFVIEKNELNGMYYVRQFLHGDIYMNTQGRKPCTVEGNTLTIPVGDDVYDSMVYMSEDYSVMIYDVLYGPMGDLTSPAVTLTLNEDGTCTMSDFFIARKDLMSAKEGTAVMYYGGLTVEKEMPKEIEFAGTYKVEGKKFVSLLGEGEDLGYEFPNEFEFVIEKNAYNNEYYVRQFLNGDIYNNTSGAFKCTAEGNTLKIPVGKKVLIGSFWNNEDWSVMKYNVLCGSESGEDGTIELTVNEDGSYTLSDFCIFQLTRTFAPDWMTFEDTDVKAVGKYVKDDGSAVESVKTADTFKAYAADGAICIVGEAVPVQVFNASGACVFSGVSSKVAGLAKGLYIVKSGNATVKVML